MAVFIARRRFSSGGDYGDWDKTNGEAPTAPTTATYHTHTRTTYHTPVFPESSLSGVVGGDRGYGVKSGCCASQHQAPIVPGACVANASRRKRPAAAAMIPTKTRPNRPPHTDTWITYDIKIIVRPSPYVVRCASVNHTNTVRHFFTRSSRRRPAPSAASLHHVRRSAMCRSSSIGSHRRRRPYCRHVRNFVNRFAPPPPPVL